MISKKLIGSGGNGGIALSEFLDVSDYVGAAPSSVAVTNLVDLSGNKGAIFLNNTGTTNTGAYLDTINGGSTYLEMDSNLNEISLALLTFNTDGFTVVDTTTFMNKLNSDYAGFTFRSGSKFFDVVEFTGTGVSQLVSHDLGVEPGMIVIKNRDSASPGTPDDWYAYHRSLNGGTTPEAWRISTNLPTAEANTTILNGTAPASASFTTLQASGERYTALLFAHDDSISGQSVCGAYTGNGSITGPVVSLGWEPQMVMIKNVDSGADFLVYDSFRSPSNPRTRASRFWAGFEERTTSRDLDFLSTGFQPANNNDDINISGGTYLYVAIRSN